MIVDKSNEIGCNGCSKKEGCYIKLLFHECPCIECLIKPRCTHICEIRKQYYSFVEYGKRQLILKEINS